MNALTALVLCTALAAGEPGAAQGGKSAPSGGSSEAAAAKSKSAAPQPKKAGTSGSLDDDLFGDLTGELFQGLDKPKLQKSLPAKESPKPPAGAKQPEGKPAPSEKKPAAKAIPPEAPDEFGPGEDLGQESNPLLDIGQRMRRVESLISRGTTGDPTQRMQKDIVSDLDKLIKIASQT